MPGLGFIALSPPETGSTMFTSVSRIGQRGDATRALHRAHGDRARTNDAPCFLSTICVHHVPGHPFTMSPVQTEGRALCPSSDLQSLMKQEEV